MRDSETWESRERRCREMRPHPLKPTSYANTSKKKVAAAKKGDGFVVKWVISFGFDSFESEAEVVWFQL